MKYVHFKIKNVNSLPMELKRAKDKILLQIIDVSDRILNNEMKADKLVLTLINGAVSHELRNPLNALVG